MAESLSLNFAVHFSEGGESPCFPLIHHQLNGGVLCEHVGAGWRKMPSKETYLEYGSLSLSVHFNIHGGSGPVCI